MDLIWAFVFAMPLSCVLLLVFTVIKARKSSEMEWISSHGNKIRILDKVFLVLFWISLLAYLLPWIAGFHWFSGTMTFNRVWLYGFDAFAYAFILVAFFGLLIIMPALLYQVIYLICNRKNNIKVKLIVLLLLFVSSLIMYFICQHHFSSVDIRTV